MVECLGMMFVCSLSKVKVYEFNLAIFLHLSICFIKKVPGGLVVEFLKGFLIENDTTCENTSLLTDIH